MSLHSTKGRMDVISKKAPAIASLGDLCRELSFLFEKDHVDVDQLQELMLSYQSNPKDWKKYAFFDRHR